MEAYLVYSLFVLYGYGFLSDRKR